jgi:hypothetical protein
MAAFTGTFNFFDKFKEYKGDNTIDMDGAGPFKVSLHTNVDPPTATDTVLADLTSEITSAGGYAAVSLTSVTWAATGAVTKFDSADPVFTATGADFDAARWWVLYDSASSGVTNALIAYGLIDDTPADVIVTDGTTLTHQWAAGGIFTET